MLRILLLEVAILTGICHVPSRPVSRPQGVKPTAAPAPSAPEATAYPPAPIASTVNNFYGPVYNDGCVYNDRSNFSKE